MLKLGRLFLNFIFSRTDKSSKQQFVFLAFITIFSSLLVILVPLFQKNIIDSIISLKLDKYLLLIFLTSGIMFSLVSVIEALLLNSLFMKIKNKIEFELLSSVSRNENSLIKQRGPGAYMVSIFGSSEQIANLLNSNYFSLFTVCISAIITLIISFQWSWVFPFIVLNSYIIMILIVKITNKLYIKNFKKAREIIYDINPRVLEFIEHRKSIRAFTNICDFENNINSNFLKRDKYLKKAFASNIFGKTSLVALKNISLSIFFILSMIEILNNNLEISSFFAMISYFNVVYIPITVFQEIYSNLNKFNSLHEKIEDHLLIEKKYKIPRDNLMHLKNISFSYKDEKKTLANFNLSVDKNIGLVGLSGEGKTTILKAIFGDIYPNSGQILFGSENIVNIPNPILFSSIRYYSQDTEIFNEDLIFNITLGKVALSNKDYSFKIKTCQNILEALKNYIFENPVINIKEIKNEFIELLKELFNVNESYLDGEEFLKNIINEIKNGNIIINSSYISSLIVSRKYYSEERLQKLVKELNLTNLEGRKLGQRGDKISGGEKNKICLARFLLPIHKGPFIIDEPFTSLDIFSEEENLLILKRYLKDNIGIIISHKMNIIKELSDKIIVLDKGLISEQGSHEELMNNNSLYFKLYQKFVNYRLSNIKK